MLHGRVLRYLDEVARLGSIRKAARTLNVAASAINRHIIELEEEVGSPIFERLPRGLRLTASGVLLIAHIRDTLRSEWASRVVLQGVALVPLDAYRTDYGRYLADIVADYGGIIGGVTRSSGGNHGEPMPDVDELLDRLFVLARKRNLDIDLHVDEAAEANCLTHVAEATIRHGYEGRVTCGHCCSLALLPPEQMEEVIALVARAGISIVTLPTVNMYLQDRQSARTPRWRGVTPVKELAAAGVRVAAAGDNCRDPFHAYGDHDMLDTFRQSVRILHADHPFGDAVSLAGPAPADILGLGMTGRIGLRHPADLIIMEAWSMDQVIARPQSDRALIKAGRRQDVHPPSYGELWSIRSSNRVQKDALEPQIAGADRAVSLDAQKISRAKALPK